MFPIDPSHLLIICKSLRDLLNWRDLLINLNMEESLLEAIAMDYGGDANNHGNVLLLWWLHSDRATKSSLVAAVENLKAGSFK